MYKTEIDNFEETEIFFSSTFQSQLKFLSYKADIRGRENYLRNKIHNFINRGYKYTFISSDGKMITLTKTNRRKAECRKFILA